MNRAELNRLHTKIFETATEVFNTLGQGLELQVYRTCLLHELRINGLLYKRDVNFPVYYKELKTPHDLPVEILVENMVIVELTNETVISPMKIAAMQTKLKICGKRMGIIISFQCAAITDGYRKVVAAV